MGKANKFGCTKNLLSTIAKSYCSCFTDALSGRFAVVASPSAIDVEMHGGHTCAAGVVTARMIQPTEAGTHAQHQDNVLKHVRQLPNWLSTMLNTSQNGTQPNCLARKYQHEELSSLHRSLF